jgi:segregation and condensation protein B
MEAKGVLEAALFISGRALSLDELAKVIGTPAKGYVKSLLEELAQDYERAQSSLCIAEEAGKYIMRVRGEYAMRVKDFAQESEISRHALKTLALIGKSSGITKRKLFFLLGGRIYEDCQELTEKGFIAQRKVGRNTALYTTAKFREYFAQ